MGGSRAGHVCALLASLGQPCCPGLRTHDLNFVVFTIPLRSAHCLRFIDQETGKESLRELAEGLQPPAGPLTCLVSKSQLGRLWSPPCTSRRKKGRKRWWEGRRTALPHRATARAQWTVRLAQGGHRARTPAGPASAVSVKMAVLVWKMPRGPQHRQQASTHLLGSPG